MGAEGITIKYQVSEDPKACTHTSQKLIGTPLTDLSILSCINPLVLSKAVKPVKPGSDHGVKIESSSQRTCKSPAAINFVRNRMFYARPALNAKGTVTFGLRHIRESTVFLNVPILTHNRRLE